MTSDQKKYIQLRDCFSAGYSLPQFCVDNGIRNPLIASYDPDFLWEIYVQFRYDKRILPEFCLLKNETVDVNHNAYWTVGGCRFEPINYEKTDKFDKYIILTTNKMSRLEKEKTIYFDELLYRICRYVYLERPLYSYINANKGVKVITANIPMLYENETNTPYEKEILKKTIFQLRAELKNNKQGEIETRFDEFGYSNAEVSKLLTLSDAKNNMDGTTSLYDNEDELVNVRNGIRQTAYQPDEYENTIYLCGTCVFYGIGVPYYKTIESYLQQLLNENGNKYRVENQSQFYATRYQDLFYNIDKLPVKDGDIIIVFAQGLLADKLPQFNTNNLFARPHDYGEVFLDFGHLNERGNKVYAQKLYDYLKQHKFMKDVSYEHIPDSISNVHMYGVVKNTNTISIQNTIVSQYADEFEKYKNELKAMRVQIGSIVMNCNPFTLGHRYLIEYAASKVEHLYIFVVEEDKSVFPFKDRIELVKKGTSHLKNVVVLPSGKFIISNLTFSGYFNKAELQEEVVDSTMDVQLFASEIAPQLGITVRFAGEEPLDMVTKQYNQAMQDILPAYGIRFEVIPRKEMDGGVISASRVRKLLNEGDFNSIERIVPTTTFEYLKKRFVKEGLHKDEQGEWFYYVNGAIDNTYTGMVKNEYGWWYVKDGKLDQNYTGIAGNEHGEWYINSGKLDFNYSGVFTQNDREYIVESGKVTATI